MPGLSCRIGIGGAIALMPVISGEEKHRARRDMHAKTYLISAMLGAFALSGCATGDGSNSGAQTGAILGALGGAAIGSTSKSHNKWVTSAVGGAIGAGIGGALGSTLDAQAADLRRDVNNPNIGIVNTLSLIHI